MLITYVDFLLRKNIKKHLTKGLKCCIFVTSSER